MCDLFTVAMLFGTCWDVGVWYFVKGLELYDKDNEDKKPNNEPNEVKPLNAESLLISSQNVDTNEDKSSH
jgi:hypothetical protein